MPRIGLVISAGGIVGHSYHAGVLHALEDVTGWDPRSAEVIVGTSAGSVTAAMLRAGFSAADLAARQRGRAVSAAARRLAARLGPDLEAAPEPPRRGIPTVASARLLASAIRNPFAFRPMTLVAAVLPPGRIPMDAAVTGLNSIFGDSWPAQETLICASDLDTGRRIVFGQEGAPRATIAQAVAASCAIPGYFQPALIDGARYIDGGVHSATNADLLAGRGLDLVVVVCSMSAAPGHRGFGLDSGLRTLVGLRLAAEISRVRRAGTSAVVFQPTIADRAAMGIDPMARDRRKLVTETAEASTRDRLTHPTLLARLEPLGRRPSRRRAPVPERG